MRPPNRLVDHDGWQEVYSGKTVWIYDAKSNQDQCVRLVSQKSAAMYGTATAVVLSSLLSRLVWVRLLKAAVRPCVFQVLTVGAPV